jgi:hypothetical protein
MRQSIAQSLIMAALFGAGQSALLLPNEYAQDFESESAGEYFNNLAEQGRSCKATYIRLYAE